MAASPSNWSVGEFATRKGRFCEIVKIHFEMDPPSVTVRMLDTNDEVGTEFSRLEKINPEDMPEHLRQKMNLIPDEPWQCSACTLINEDPHATQCSLCETPRVFNAPSSPEIPHGGDSPMLDVSNMETAEEQMEENEWAFIDNPDNELNIITWNVWFREDIEIGQRVEAILSHAANCEAHVIVLQEVTPLILELIQNAPFYTRGAWETYGADIALERGLAYFVVILSRLPAANVTSSIRSIPLTTNMGRYCLSMDFSWKGEAVTVATAHLESREGKTNKYSKVRHSQIQTCFETLSEKSHVIFAGDMNWVDSDASGDGVLEVPREWQDVWLRLRGNEAGATYDEQTNEMVLGLAQHRLDRVFLKGGDRFVARSIEMIGRDPIPGLTFERPVRNESLHETRHVPVFPSSHYGLCGRFVVQQQ